MDLRQLGQRDGSSTGNTLCAMLTWAFVSTINGRNKEMGLTYLSRAGW